MEAKDTVMSMEQRRAINDAMPSTAKYGEVFEAIAETQAELSFKAGYEAVWKDGVIKDTFEIGQQEGRKDVVDWVERVRKIKVPKYQLKEWGL